MPLSHATARIINTQQSALAPFLHPFTNKTWNLDLAFDSSSDPAKPGSRLPPPSWPLEKVAIADITASALPDTEARALSEWFHNAVEETKYLQLVARTEMKMILDEQKFQRTGSCDDSQCLVEMGRILTVRKMIGCSLGRVGDKVLFIARLVDVETGEILCSARGSSSPDSDSMLAMINQTALSLCTEYGKTRQDKARDSGPR